MSFWSIACRTLIALSLLASATIGADEGGLAEINGLVAVKGKHLAQQTLSEPEQGSPTQHPAPQAASPPPQVAPRQPDGDGSVRITGELQQWHKVTLSLAGPFAHEQDTAPNPFTDYRLTVDFTHEDGSRIRVPGYFAADGDAGQSSAEMGTCWRAHVAPDKVGKWTYRIAFEQGKSAALDPLASKQPLADYHGQSGSFTVMASDKSGRDLRGHGLLQYVGKHYLQFAGSKKYFLKVGADAPETLLAYRDFDNTVAGKPQSVPLKSWAPHIQDWREGDPSWRGGKGKGLIGAVNYLSAKGCNAFSFLTYNAGGDGDNVWPFTERDDKLHYDCSKLDQWGIVFDHATAMGMYLHFKMQETENDSHHRRENTVVEVPESLDGGDLGIERRLYCRELIARFAHNLALNWNLGEENTQSTEQQQAMLDYIAGLDAYQHLRVLHTYPNQQELKYLPLLGEQSKLTGLSLQNNHIQDTHVQTIHWVATSARAGKPWVVAFDESGSAAHGQCPDTGYRGYDGHDRTGLMTYSEHEVRQQTLWGTLLGGGAGVEYYFGYQYVENDLTCEDWRSRDRSWDYCRIAIDFFHQHDIPFWSMTNQDALVGNPQHDNSKYCFATVGQVYLVYLPHGGSSELDLGEDQGAYTVRWFNPRQGGDLQSGSVKTLTAGGVVQLGQPPSDATQDWLVVLRR
ncbi:MAG: DUF5060 domain-containing protein [Planctomycetales bacterium]|nr:DUF5060 domain-containing protein [Planctomycetales bacterium]